MTAGTGSAHVRLFTPQNGETNQSICDVKIRTWDDAGETVYRVSAEWDDAEHFADDIDLDTAMFRLLALRLGIHL